MLEKKEKRSAEVVKSSSDEKVSVLENLREKKDILTKDPQTIPMARLDFLSSGGKVVDSVEYVSETDFLKALKEELYYGVPLTIVLYRDENGKTISKSFLEDLDTLPKGLTEEAAPEVRKRKFSLDKGDEP